MAEAFVVPRFLRRPVRFVARMHAEGFAPPRFAFLGLSAGLVGLSLVAGAASGGHMPSVVEAVTAASGFAVEDIRIAGNREASEIDVIGQIGLDGATSLIGFDAAAARQRIADLPWIESVTVRKIYPDALAVEIAEKKPFAIWQHGQELTLVERDGSLIAPFRSERYAMLPLVIGVGAREEAAPIVDAVAAFPALAPRVKAYIRISDRRWDLRLENGVTVRLPENGVQTALREIVAIDQAQGLLSRDIVAVDMRFSDRLVVRLSPEAAIKRDAAVRERLKLKPREKRA